MDMLFAVSSQIAEICIIRVALKTLGSCRSSLFFNIQFLHCFFSDMIVGYTLALVRAGHSSNARGVGARVGKVRLINIHKCISSEPNHPAL